MALRFLREGWNVWALVRRPEAAIEVPADQRRLLHPVHFDAESSPTVEAAAQAVLQQAGKLDALVNNAGIAISAPLAKTTDADFAKVMQVNVTAPWQLCRAVIPAMVKAGGGRVVNVASTAALKGFRYTSAYCASKHALLGLTRALAHELAAKNVTVNAVCPGWTDTDMLAGSVGNIVKATGRSADDARAELAKMTPQGRFVTADEVAELTWFLAANDAAKSITGAAYSIDGGETL